MARESKGKLVKTFKHFEPQPDHTSNEVTGKVYFQAKDGLFVIHLPEHIRAMLGALESCRRQGSAGGPHIHERSGECRSNTLDGVMGLHKTVLAQYTEAIKLSDARRAIEVRLKKNVPWREGRPDRTGSGHAAVGGGFGETISFCGSPALFMNFRVLWRVNDDLYQRHETEAYGERPAYSILSYAGRVKEGGSETVVIEWTQEREDFLAGVVTKITDLAWLLSDFLGDAETNLTHALTAGGGQLLLAPKTEAK